MALLGHIVSRERIEVDSSKVESMKEWPVPKSVTEICSFLGLAGYYRNFIKSFLTIALPLTSLTKKNAKFIWGLECQNSLDQLRQDTTAPVLALSTEQGFDLDVYARGKAPNLATLTRREKAAEQGDKYGQGKMVKAFGGKSYLVDQDRDEES
ncbi:putative mitochondrial protein AtMg00860 [Primulina tabacum]|uniref:putative mitochondrial protein AtMg00860 n=1 Tax=Primulina tabacum TaxID=48773 RepID=UPI003F59555B